MECIRENVGRRKFGCPTGPVPDLFFGAVVAAAVIVLLPGDSCAEDAIGRIAGSFEVTSGGAATYEIPIAVPAGANGLVPEISLRYNSQSREGLAGFGWSLSGLSTISRCRSVLAVDGEFRGVRYDTDDRLCLDGRPLIHVGGSEYRTEIHRYERITAIGSITGASPAYFRLEMPSGRELIYGNAGGGLDATVSAAGTAEVRSWLLKSIIDPYDNRIEFFYFNEPDTGENHPVSVTWSSNHAQGTSAQYSLAFEYEDRRTACDGVRCQDVRSGYVFGVPWERGHRLSRIRYRHAGDDVHTWALEYLDSSATGRSALRSVQQCGHLGGKTECLPPTEFEIHDTAVGWLNIDSQLFPTVPGIGWDTAQAGDFDADGDDELFWINPATNRLHLFYRESSGYLVDSTVPFDIQGGEFFATLDHDGDGDTDILSNGGGSWAIGESVGQTEPAYATIELDGMQGGEPHVIDVNRDGRDDLVLQCSQDMYRLCMRANTFPGGIFSAEYSSGLPRLEASVIGNWINFVRRARKTRGVLDFDGDGRQDIVVPVGDPSNVAATPTWQAHLSTGIDFEPVAMGSFIGVHVVTLDVNGDGLSDVVYSKGTWRVRLSTGAGFTREADTGIPAQFGISPVIVDYESDGLDDLLLPVGDRWLVFRSDGRSYSSSRSVDSGAPSPMHAAWMIPANIRGHGESDLYIARVDTSKWTFDFHLGSGDKDLLRKATDGLGNEITVFHGSIYNVSTEHDQGASSTSRKLARFPSKFVSSFRGNDGVGGEYSRSYAYRGARIDLSGRGFLGFGQIDIDDSRGGASTTSYDQAFPFIGRVLARQVWQTAAREKLRSHSESIYDVETGAAAAGDAAVDFHFVHEVERIDTEFDQHGAATRTVRVTGSDFDSSHGIARTTTTEISSPRRAGTHTKVRSVEPDDAGLIAGYCLGLPATVELTRSGPDGITAARTVRFTNNITRCNQSLQTIDPQGLQPFAFATNYDAFGNVAQMQSYDVNAPGAQRETRISYDQHGYRAVSERYLLARSISACGNSSTSTWDTVGKTWNYALGLEATRTGVNGLGAKRTYDSFGRTVRVESLDDGTSVDLEYRSCSGFCPPHSRYEISVSGSDGRNAKSAHDAYGRRLGQSRILSDGRESRVKYVFDALGRMTRRTVPYIEGDSEYWVDYGYDELDRPAWVNRPLDQSMPSGAVSSYVYDGLNVTETNSENQVTMREYHSTGDLASVTDAMGGVTRYTYDAFRQLTSIVDPLGNVRTFGYDDKGRMIAADDPDSGSWSFEYSAFGQMTSRTDDKPASEQGRSLYHYDRRGRLISRRDVVGGLDIGRTDWSYHTQGRGRGRLRQVSGPELGYRETYDYDSVGLLARTTTTIDGQSYVTQWTYDDQRRVNTMVYPQTVGGNRPSFRYSYNERGYLASVHETTGGIDTALYTIDDRDDPLGRITAATFGFGAGAYPERSTYDAANYLLTSIRTGVAGSFQDREYTWDSLANLVSRAALDRQGSPMEMHVYDALNRLTQATTTASLGSPTVHTLSYDSIGNIKSKSDIGNYDYSGDSGPHAVDSISGGAAGTISLAYDANGNTTRISDDPITWTMFNKPRRIARKGHSVTFSYGPRRQRIRRSTGSASIVYAGPHFEVENDGASTVFTSRVFADGRMIFMQKEDAEGPSSRGFFVHQDYHGSVDTLVQAYGSETSEVLLLAFDAFGKRRNLDWSADPADERTRDDHVTEIGYTGHEHLDDVGLIHMNGRIQDPAIGRMLSPDPVFGRPGDPQSQNPYSYVRNNPATLTDPSGYRVRHKLIGRGWTNVYFPNGRGGRAGGSGRGESGPRLDAWSPYWVQAAQGDRFCVGCRQQYAHEDWSPLVADDTRFSESSGQPPPVDNIPPREEPSDQPPAAADSPDSWWEDAPVDLDLRASTSMAFVLAFGVGIQGSFELDMDFEANRGTLVLSPEFVVAGLGASMAFEPSLEATVGIGPVAESPFPVAGTLCTTGICGGVTLFDQRLATLSARAGLILGEAATFSVHLPAVEIPLAVYPTVVPLRGIPLF